MNLVYSHHVQATLPYSIADSIIYVVMKQTGIILVPIAL